MIRIGTSGFSYDDWSGPFYPAGLPARAQLAFYARAFSTVEINTTYYRVPDVRLVQGWAERTPADFLFAVKAYQGLTHERERPDCAPFVAALQPLVAAGKLACILAQFSPTPFTRRRPTGRTWAGCARAWAICRQSSSCTLPIG